MPLAHLDEVFAPYGVLLADDHRIVAEGLRALLEPEFELVGIVEDGRALLEAVQKLRPDVVVADITMPKLNGIEALKRLREDHEGIRVIFLTMHRDVAYAVRAFEAGAVGYVLKHSAPSDLLDALRAVLKGGTYVPPAMAGELMASYRRGASQRQAPDQLTPRQREVLQLLAEGKSAKEVAAILEVSTRTAEFHKYRIMSELGLDTSAELVQFAVKHGLI